MIEGIVIAVLAAVIAFLCSGARTAAYLLYFLSFIPFITLDASAGGLVDAAGFGAGNVLFKMSVRLTVTLGFLVLFLRRRSAFAQLTRPQSLPVLLFFCWALLSVHRAQSPAISLLRLGELLMFFVGGVVLFTESARFHAPRTVARWHCLALLQILLVLLYFEQSRPELAYFVTSDGIKRLGHKFLNSNSLGFACAVVLLWSTVELKEGREHKKGVVFERVIPAIAGALAIYILLGARSRSAMITVILGQIVIWFPFRQPDRWRRPAFALISLLVVVGSIAYFEHIAAWFLRGESTEGLVSGTGRTELWSALIREQLPGAPILGHGYLMLGQDGSFFHNGTYWINAHNTYLFALIATGIPGLVALLIVALLPWAILFRRIFATEHADRPFWILLFALQSVILTASITGFGISGYPNPAMLFHYSLYSYAATRLQPPPESTRPDPAPPSAADAPLVPLT